MPPQGQIGKSSEIPGNSSHDTESFPLSQRVTTSTAVDGFGLLVGSYTVS